MKPLEREIEDIRRHLQVIEEHACGDRSAVRIPAATAKDLASALESMLACIGAGLEQHGQHPAGNVSAAEGDERYCALFASAPTGLVVTDLSCTIREVNRKASALLGAAADHLVALPLLQFIPDEDREMLLVRLGRLAPDEEVWDWETQVRSAGCEPVPVAISVSVIRDDGTRAPGYLWVFHEISSQKQTEAEILKREERFRAIVQDQTELIFRWLPDGTITFVNDAYCRYVGASVSILNKQYNKYHEDNTDSCHLCLFATPCS